MDASLALLLTMTRHYCGIVSTFNARFSGWAEFYRKEILNDGLREAVQDSTYITVEPDKDKAGSTFSFPKGTEFLAGKVADGGDLLYALDEKGIHRVCRTLHGVDRVQARRQAVCSLPAVGGKPFRPPFHGKRRDLHGTGIRLAAGILSLQRRADVRRQAAFPPASEPQPAFVHTQAHLFCLHIEGRTDRAVPAGGLRHGLLPDGTRHHLPPSAAQPRRLARKRGQLCEGTLLHAPAAVTVRTGTARDGTA